MALDESLDVGAGMSGTVHQTMHGYREGHRLLASSVPLPQAALDVMLSLTDAVDVYDDPAFPELLAIYPLPDTDWVAASLTWPATDVGRAGAVWTHTLIAEAATLEFGGSALGTLFRRPTSAIKRELEHYSRPLVLSLSGADSVLPDSLDVAARIAWALHELPTRSVIADTSELAPPVRHRLLIGLVAQCWPALTEQLTCGEATNLPRQLGPRSFDLTVTGRRGTTTLSRGLVERPRVMPASTTVTPPQWAALMASEAFRPNGLTEFLRRFGPAAREDRAAVKPLAQVYAQLSETTNSAAALPGVLQVLASAFPLRSDMAEFKMAIFGALGERSLTADLRDTDILAMLLTDPHARCLSTVDLKLTERAAAVAASSLDDAVQLLRVLAERDKMPDSAKAVCAGLVTGISASDLRDLSRKHPDLIAALVDVHPAVLERSELWEGSPIALLEVLSRRINDRARRRMIAATAARIADLSIAHALVEGWPREIEESLNTILAFPPALDVWARALSATTLSEWLAAQQQPSATQVLKVASKLTASQASLIPSDTWLAAAPAVGSAPFDERGFATLLCVAVRIDKVAAAELACGAADRLWGAIVSDDLERDDVRLDLIRLSKSSSKPNLAEGVIRRIVKCFNKRGWPAEAALQLRNLDAFQRLLETDAATHPGGSIAQRLLSHLPPDASAEQVEVMEMVVKCYAPREDLVHMLEGFVRRLTSGR